MTTELPVGNFNYPTAYRIGWGRRRELAAACCDFRMDKPLLVTDPGIAKLPWFAEVCDALAHGGVDVQVFSAIKPNPDGEDVSAGVQAFRHGGRNGVILLGGGSAMDAGKCIALLANNPGTVFDYEDVGDNFKKADAAKVAPIIAIPTTAGTGSEVGRASVIVDAHDHNKKIIFHPRMQPSLVLADPELTVGLPAGLTAATGMDALAHCFEAYCAPGYHPMADGIALEGMRLVHENLRRVYANGQDKLARTHMMMAASMGATAFQKGLGLVHALSHPLGGATGIHHGTANAIFMPYVMVFNREVIEPAMDRLARFLRLDSPGFDGVMTWMLDLRRDLGLPHTLEAASGFDAAMAKKLAPLAVLDPSMGTNPKPVTEDEAYHVFLKALAGDLS